MTIQAGRWWVLRKADFLHPKKPKDLFRADVEKLRSLFHYCPATGLFTRTQPHSRYPNASNYKRVVGHTTAYGYVRLGIEGGYFKAHRLAWIYVHGEEPAGVIDHIDGDRANNRISNLRCVSQAENMRNVRGPKRTNKLGMRGVTKFVSSSGKTIYKATICIGSFATPELAQEAYSRVREQLFGLAWPASEKELSDGR